MQSQQFEFQAFGQSALFSDPVMRVGGQKCSYPVPTYEALKGLVKNIYWKPTLIWFIDEVRVMQPIRMFPAGVRPIHYQDAKNDLAYYTYLEDVRYQVKCHFEWNLNQRFLASDRKMGKHTDMFLHALERGGRLPLFFGTSECRAFVEPCVFGHGDGHYDKLDAMDFGVMFHGITYPDEAYSLATQNQMTVRMWKPVMKNGVISFIRPEFCEMTKQVRPMKMHMFGQN